MTPDDVRAAAEQLVEFHERFAPLFGKEQAQDHAYTYVNGLMCCPERKSIEPIALCTGTGQVSGLQKFIAVAPWQSDDVQAEIQSAFADELVPSAAGTPIGTVGVIDESAFAKKGAKSAGVARQHNGRLGKEDNCQVGVFLIGVTPAGTALLDHQLYLHGSWFEGEVATQRRAEAHIPEDLPFRTKPQIAAALVRDVTVLGIVGLDWVTADEEYGTNGDLLDELEQLDQRYVMEVPTTTTVWTADPASCIPPYSGRGQPPKCPNRAAVCSVAELAAGLPADAWQRLQVARGGGRAAGLRVRGGAGLGGPPPQARAADLGAGPPFAGGDSRGQVLRQQRRCRDAIASDGVGRVHEAPGGGFLRGLQRLPRDGAVRDAVVGRVAPPHYIGRVGAPVRGRDAVAVEKKVPELTLDRTVRLLEAALEEPELKLSRAVALVDYHVRRNKVAKASHDKTWKEKHKGVNYLRL